MTRKPLVLALLAGLALLPSLAAAQCCPSDGHTAPAKKGLGTSTPPATDLATDPAWQVYEFERGGVRYLQINDGNGVVRAAVGRIDNIVWALPVGADAERVGTPGEPAPVAVSGAGTVIYRDAEIEVRRYQTASGDVWSVSPIE